MVPVIFFDSSPSSDVVRYEAEVFGRHMEPALCAPGEPPPCFAASAPAAQSWVIVQAHQPGSDWELWTYDVEPGEILMVRIRAVDRAGNKSEWAAEVK